MAPSCCGKDVLQVLLEVGEARRVAGDLPLEAGPPRPLVGRWIVVDQAGSQSSSIVAWSPARNACSTRAELLRRLGRDDEARAAYARALELTESGPEQRFLEGRLARLSERAEEPSDPMYSCSRPRRRSGLRRPDARACPRRRLGSLGSASGRAAGTNLPNPKRSSQFAYFATKRYHSCAPIAGGKSLASPD